MAANVFILDPFESMDDVLLLNTPILETISGTVKDEDGNPLRREVRLYRREQYIADSDIAKTPIQTTWSNAETGAFSFTVNEYNKMEWVVICVGNKDENIISYNKVKVGV